MAEATGHFPLEENASLLRALVDHSPDGMLLLDSSGVVRFANPAAEQLFSQTETQLIGFQFSIPQPMQDLEIPLAGEEDVRTISLRFSALTWKGKRIFLATLRDISERVVMEKEIQTSEQRFRYFFEHAILGFALHEIIYDDAGKAVDFKYLDVNDAFGIQTGLDGGQVVGRMASELLPSARETGLIDTFGEIARTGVAQRLTYYSSDLDRYLLISVYSPGEGQVASTLFDVSDQVAAEQELQQSEEKFRSLYETMTQGVIYHNSQGEVLSANPAAERLMGRKLNSIKGQVFTDPEWELVSRDRSPMLLSRYPVYEAMRTGRSVHNQVVGFVRPEHRGVNWFNISAVPFFDPGETEPTRIVSTFLDITDEVRINDALEVRVKELKCIANVSTTMQEDHPIEEVCQRVVQELAATLEVPEDVRIEVVLDGTCYENRPPVEGLKSSLSVPIKAAGKVIGEISACYPKEQEYLLPGDEGLLVSIAERLASYYERQQVQRRLVESEARFRKAIMDAPNPILLHDEKGTVIEVNAAFTDLTGYSLEEVANLEGWLTKTSRIPQVEPETFVGEVQPLEGGLDEGEFLVRTRTGDVKTWYLSSAHLGITPENRELYISMGVDISARVEALRERQQYYNRTMAMREISNEISSTLDLDRLLNLVTTEMEKILTFDTMSIQEIKDDYLEIIACHGFEDPDRVVGLRFPAKPEYPNYDVIKKKETVTYVHISDVYTKFHQPLELDSSRIVSWLGVPLVSQDKVIGMFTIDRFTEEPFTDEDIEIARQFADQAAVALNNAQLYQQTRYQLKKLEVLRKIDALISSDLDLDQIFQAVLGYIVDGLEVDAASVLLFDPESQQLGFANGLGFRSEIRSDIRIDLGQGYSGRVAQTREPLFSTDIETSIKGSNYPEDLNVEGIETFYAIPLVAKGELEGVLQVFSRKALQPDEEWFNFADALAAQTAIAVNNITLFRELEEVNVDLINAYDATIAGWAHALELRDQETEGHSQRVVEMSVRLAQEFGFDEEALAHIRRGVYLHDIGKMGIPDHILRKPGPLTEEEWDVMRRHPGFAYDMLKDIAYLKPALVIPHYHHERWNGTGYPEGLAGEDIPLIARIFAVVDIWDALISDRPYRDAWTREEALAYIRDQAGKELDPQVVEAFLRLFGRE